MKIGVLVNAFARTTELQACLSSVLEATQNITDTRLVMHQKGIDASMSVSGQFRSSFNVKYVLPPSSSALVCINSNRVLGLEILFEEMKVDAVLSVEDDVEISRDSGVFCKSILEQFYEDENFRGINLGSRIPSSNEPKLLNSYSLLRYGLHGQAGVITKRTWNYIRKRNLGSNPNSGFDAQIEAYLKTGFMATSNVSRYLDRGFDMYATHATRDSKDVSFTRIAESYIGREYFPELPTYELIQEDHSNWRIDAIPYRRIDDIKYWIKFKLREFLGRIVS
jgi:hypothetical protein